jgi:hypothetical protein
MSRQRGRSHLATVVQDLLQAHRRDNLVPAGLGHLPLVITEYGWPTGPGRTPQRQAEVLRTVIDVISRNAEALNITGYIHHTLRDARSAGSGLFCQFGLMTDPRIPRLPGPDRRAFAVTTTPARTRRYSTARSPCRSGPERRGRPPRQAPGP